jgi:hypothetical protein
MSDISAIASAVSATGSSSGTQLSIAVSVLGSAEQEMAKLASILMASLGVGQGVSTEA